MNERMTVLAAGVVAAVLVGGFAMVSRGHQEPQMLPIVVSQRPVGPRGSGNVGAGFKGVELRFLPPKNRPLPEQPDEDEPPVVYRVVDAAGRVYATTVSHGDEPMQVSISSAYGHPVNSPRLVAYIDEVPRGSIGLAPFPKPDLRPLGATKDARLRAFHAAGSMSGIAPGGPDSHIEVRPTARIPEDEVWDIQLIATNLAQEPLATPAGPTVSANESAIRGPIQGLDSESRTCEFSFTYPNDVEAVRLRVVRRRRRIRSEDVPVSGLRLTKQGDRAVFEPKKPIPFKKVLGLDLNIGPVAVPYKSDAFTPGLELSTRGRHFPERTTSFPTGNSVNADPAPSIVVGVPYPKAQRHQGGAWNRPPSAYVHLLSPNPKDLGLDGINGWTYHPLPPTASRKLRLGPVDLKLRVDYVTWENLETFEVTLPVERASG